MTVSGRLRRKIRSAVVLLLGIVSVLAAAGWAERERNAGEEYSVYSAYLSEGLSNDAHDWSVGGPVQVVVRNTTELGRNPRWRLLYPLDGRGQFHQLRTSTWASYLVRNLFKTRIVSKFVLPSRATVAIASELDYNSPDFQEKFPHNLGFIALSGVGFNPSRTQAAFTSTTFVDYAAGDATY